MIKEQKNSGATFHFRFHGSPTETVVGWTPNAPKIASDLTKMAIERNEVLYMTIAPHEKYEEKRD